MSRVLAAITDDGAAARVLAAADAIANLYAATVDAVHVGGEDAALADAARIAGAVLRRLAGTPVEALARAALADDVDAVVLGAPSGAGDTVLALITVLEKPAVVVPADGAHAGRPVERILVPLDGTPECAVALEEIVALARDAAIEIVIAHVHQPHALPAFSDQLAHEVAAWSEEFLARNCPGAPEATLELRVGEPHEYVLDIARHSGCDLVALGWGQDLAAGRAAVVRRMLSESPVPVLVTPARGARAASLPMPDDAAADARA